MDRFSRTKTLLGSNRFHQLSTSYVVVVGLGAVGGYVVEGLVRGGIGRLKLVDFDLVSRTNINRQLLALETTLHRPKSEVALERAQDINPACQVQTSQVFVDEETVQAVLDPVPDLLIDAIDALNPKVQLLTAAFRQGIPILSSMGAALRTDPGKITFADISKTYGCPLAKRVRKRLRKQGIEQGIGCVYSSESVDFIYEGPMVDMESPQKWRGRQRNVLGSLPTITGIFGLVLANQAILHLAGAADSW
ncbi:MAG: tRNA threonylcarbamoyladenosine dehydratase [Desulfobulbus propionicus]|nr:MAG: tRNA threonylcarbamoyladenosine dehydratase [Desulfobulbus propionicus]